MGNMDRWAQYQQSLQNPGNDMVSAYQNKGSASGAFQPSSEPQEASPGGALSGEAPAQGAEPAFDMAGDSGLGVGEARKPEQPGNDFFGMYRSASDEDKDHMAGQMEEQFAPFGLSLDGAVTQMWQQNPQLAAELGKKFGFVPPADQAGKPGFKTEAQALADYEEATDKQKAAAEKAKLKKEKRQAMGGFLFEMGLRILASNRPDAGGAIAEGALGTLDARAARKEHTEDRGMAKEDRTRKQKFEDTDESRAEAENRRREAENARQQETHEAMKSAGKLAVGTGGHSVAEFDYDLFKRANASKGWDDETLSAEYLKEQERRKRMKPAERERLIQNYIKMADELPPEGVDWDGMSWAQKRQFIIDNSGFKEDEEGDSTTASTKSDGESSILSFDEMS